MKVEFETTDGESTYADPKEAHNSPDSKGYIWIRTRKGEIKKADMVEP